MKVKALSRQASCAKWFEAVSGTLHGNKEEPKGGTGKRQPALAPLFNRPMP
jgi:hypothetical protein